LKNIWFSITVKTTVFMAVYPGDENSSVIFPLIKSVHSTIRESIKLLSDGVKLYVVISLVNSKNWVKSVLVQLLINIKLTSALYLSMVKSIMD